MAQLIYVTPMSLDGYLGRDNYDWSNPGDEGHRFITEAIRPFGTYLYGRKLYQTMAVWEDPDFLSSAPPAMQEFAQIWQAADKIVYSKSLASVSTAKTRLEREFSLSAIREWKAQSTRDLSIGGAELAAQAIRGGLVDEYQFFVVPFLLGGGIPVLPRDVSIGLELLEQQRFGDGWLYLRYRSRA